MKNVIILLITFGFLFIGQNVIAQNIANLSDTEKDGIQFMLEEEKLARDVYLTLNEKWETTVFSHISNSEQQHVDKMKKLATQFGVKIPATVEKNELGKFQNKALQNLYDELVKTGNTSLENALRVGAKIEELDIRDLNETMAETKNERILKVYQNLKSASENHLRAFNQNLKKEGVAYAPVILSQKDFDRIVNTKAACQGEKGAAKGCCSQKGKSTQAEKGCGGKGKNKKGKSGACCSSS